MSKQIFEHSRLIVTSYTGPANTMERTRMRLQFDAPVDPDTTPSLGFNDVVALHRALGAWIVEYSKSRKEG